MLCWVAQLWTDCRRGNALCRLATCSRFQTVICCGLHNIVQQGAHTSTVIVLCLSHVTGPLLHTVLVLHSHTCIYQYLRDDKYMINFDAANYNNVTRVTKHQHVCSLGTQWLIASKHALDSFSVLRDDAAVTSPIGEPMTGPVMKQRILGHAVHGDSANQVLACSS